MTYVPVVVSSKNVVQGIVRSGAVVTAAQGVVAEEAVAGMFAVGLAARQKSW